MGDALLARRALDSLCAAWGRDGVVVAAPLPITHLLAGDQPQAQWIPSAHGLEEARKLARAWKRAGVRRAVLFPTSFSSRWAGLRSGASQRIGHGPRPSGRREWEAAFGLTLTVPRGARGARHLEEEYLDLARAAGGELVAPRALAVPDKAAAQAAAWLADAGDVLVLAPGARFGPAKRWPAERYAAAGRSWKRGRVVLVGGEEDREQVLTVAEGLERATINLAGKTDLPALTAVLARATAVVSNDSGVAHLAAAVGAPTIVVFGSTDPRWTAPRGEHVTAIWDHVSCSPCFLRRCPYVDAYACLRIVGTERVLAVLPR